MLHYLFAIFHWNACFSHILSRYLSKDIMQSLPHKQNNNHRQDAVVTTTSSSSSTSSPLLSKLHYATNDLLNKSFNLKLYSSSSSSNHNEHYYKSSLYNIHDTNYNQNYRPTKATDLAETDNELLIDYLKAFYLSTKIMTLVSDMPNPTTSQDYLFAIFELIVALLLFATIMGHVGYIVTSLGNARKEFQCKTYITPFSPITCC